MSPPPTNNQVNLPLDILEQIVEWLAITKDFDCEGFSTIKAFALLCRAALPICRKHLFGSITIHDDPGHQPITGSIYNMPTAYPHLAPYIRTLTFDLVTSEPCYDLSRPSMSKISQRLTRLRKLDIWGTLGEGINWKGYRMHLLPILHLPTVTDLTLWCITDFPISDLIPCPALKRLAVRSSPLRGVIVDSIRLPLAENPISITIEEFEWFRTKEEEETTPTIRVAQRTDGKPIFDFSKLRVLSLNLSGLSDLHALQDLFWNCCQLTDLRLDLRLDGVAPTTMGLFDLVRGSLQTLKCLTLGSEIRDNPKRGRDDPFSGLCQELEKISGQNVLTSLTLHMLVDIDQGYDYTPGDGWGALGKVLTGDGFASLVRVSISPTLNQVEPWLDNGALEAKLSRHFRALEWIPTLEFSLAVFCFHSHR